jgi:hypothetical protein
MDSAAQGTVSSIRGSASPKGDWYLYGIEVILVQAANIPT